MIETICAIVLVILSGTLGFLLGTREDQKYHERFADWEKRRRDFYRGKSLREYSGERASYWAHWTRRAGGR